MSETATLTGPLLKAYKQAGALAFRMQSGSLKKGKHWVHLCDAGTADILVFPRSGGVVWVETKAADGHTNREQVENQSAFRDKVLALGHRHIRATSIEEGLAALTPQSARPRT